MYLINGKSIGHLSNSGEKSTLTYLIMINSEEQKRQAEVLISSIRRFGGAWSNSPVMIVKAAPTVINCESLTGEAEWIVDLEMPESLRSFPFADKVYACARAEKMVAGKTSWLLWLNPDALMVAPPAEIVSGSEAWASLRPVHIQNIGIEYAQSLTGYWKRIFDSARVDTNSLWPIKSYVDNIALKPYYNSGCMAFRPEKGILGEWKNVFELMLSDKTLYSYYTNYEYGAFFFHQAVLSAVIISGIGKDRINILPPSYGYPLSQQHRQDFLRKINYIDEMKIILCEDYNYLQNLIMGETYSSWLDMKFGNKKRII